MGLMAELKRRNVIRVGAAYLVSSWLLIEISDIMFPAFGFPPDALKWLIGALILGLIPMLIFSWVYELTPEGLIKDQGPGHQNPENIRTGKRLDQVTIIMILLALAVVAVERFVLPQRVMPETTVVAEGAVEQQPQVVVQVPAMPIPDGPSIAVLPFANMSADADNEYFADGISEEILNVLAGIEGLKVASRTSAFAFKGTDTAIPDIARQLGVAHVLEGSVRKAGMRVRITAQLIDADTDAHLWSDSYDRELTDIFAVQEEIANAISAALGDALGVQVAGVSVEASTSNLEAYELFLQGRTLFYQRGAALPGAQVSLERAVELDPAFSAAWATLSATLFVMPSYHPVDNDTFRGAARRAARRAIELDDGLAIPYAVLGQTVDDEPAEGLRMLDAAIERDPDESTALLWRGLRYISLGYLAEAEADLRRAIEADPQVGINHGWLGAVAGARGRIDEALAHLERSAGMGWPTAHWFAANILRAEGRIEEAADRMERFYDALSIPDPMNRAFTYSVVAHHRGEATDADVLAALARFDASDEQANSHDLLLASAGMVGLGLERHLRMDSDSQDNVVWGAWLSSYERVRSHPLYLRIAERYGMAAFWEAEGYPPGCTRVEDPEPHLDCDR